MTTMEKGDLCYIPQNVTLIDEYDGVPTDFVKTIKPQTAVYLKKDSENWIKVFFQGSEWYVPREEVYPLQEAYCVS